MVAKRHTFNTNIYRAVAFSSLLENSFEVRRSILIFQSLNP